MKHSSSIAASLASSASGTTTSPSLTPAGLASCPSIDFDDYPHGPIVKVMLYHPSLLKVEADFPNIMCVQEIPCNRFFASKPPPMALGAELHPIPDFVKNWHELLLVPLIHKSIHKICMVLQISDADTKVDLIAGVLGQGATFRDQDILLSYDNFPTTHRYLCTVQFKKSIANLNFSSDDAASMTVFLHLENNSYSIFDGMLMNPHVSPYTARTNSALRAIVDLLLQQAAFKQTSTVPAPLDFAILADVLPPSPILPVADSSAPALVVNIPAAPASAACIPAVTSLPLASPGIRSNLSSTPGSPYTFQTCPPTMLSQADPSWAALGAGS